MKYLIVLTIILFGCDKYSREDFSFSRRDYVDNGFNLNGYYYHEFAELRFSYYFFFEDGVILSASTSSSSGTSYNSEEDFFNDMKGYDFEQLKILPYWWGIFKGDNYSIEIETWGSGTGGKYPVIEKFGEILNDTTLKIGGDTYNYKYFYPKPDSTNQWIE